MVNWQDPAEIQRDAEVFAKLIFALFGLYVWELFMTCDFEWSLITKRRNFRLPLIFFFLCRYCMLLALIGLILALSITTRVDCKALFTFNSWTGNMSILCASTSLMLRTLVLWDRKLYVVVPLGILCVSHWALLYRGMFNVKADWSEEAKACIVTAANPMLLNATFFFTMGFDFIILAFTAVALFMKHSARTDLWKLLFQDGLGYFLITFTCNCIPAVFAVLDLNMIMNVIATIPAATITAIASCRAVIRLLEFSSGEIYVQGKSAVVSKTQKATRPEIHVMTEQITMGEFEASETPSPDITLGRKTDVNFLTPSHTDSPYGSDDKIAL